MKLLSLFGQVSSYDYYTLETQTIATNNIAAIIAMIFIITLLFGLVIYVITAIFLGMIFKKASEPSWKAWVPIYNSWTLLELGDQKGFWAIVALIPIVNIVAAIFLLIAMYFIGLKLGKSDAFVLLAIFLPLVWVIWLAVDSSTWKTSETMSNPKKA